jgi:hypothetical protein
MKGRDITAWTALPARFASLELEMDCFSPDKAIAQRLSRLLYSSAWWRADCLRVDIGATSLSDYSEFGRIGGVAAIRGAMLLRPRQHPMTLNSVASG